MEPYKLNFTNIEPYTLKWWLKQLDKCSHSIGILTQIKHQAHDEQSKRTAQSLIDYYTEKREWLIDRINEKYKRHSID